MSVQDIEVAIAQLGPGELAELFGWLQDFDAERWDRQIVQDAKAGRFDALIARANEDFDAGRCKPL